MRKIPSIKNLKPICQPFYKFEKTIFLVYVFRSFSIYVTRFFLILGISANSTSIISMFTGLIASILLINFSFINLLISSLLLFLHTLLDFVDGEVARFNSDGTPTGKYLDDVNHSINVPTLMLLLSFGLFNYTDDVSILFLGALAAMCEAIGHNVDWGYPNRIILQELKINKDKPKYIKNIKENLFEKTSIFIDKILNINPLFKKLYDKIWIENRIVNFVMFIGFLSPIFYYFDVGGIEREILILIICFYGINRPFVMFQFYFQNIYLTNKRIERKIDSFFKK